MKSDRVQEYCASVEYVRGDFTFQGEYLRTRNRQSYSPLQLQVTVPFPPFSIVTPYELGAARIDTEGFYFMPSYRVLPALEIGGYASFYHQDFKERKTERSNDYQYDYALTAKYDVFDWWTVKVEGHRVDGSGSLNVPDKQTAYFGGSDTGVKSWWYVVAKTTFSF